MRNKLIQNYTIRSSNRTNRTTEIQRNFSRMTGQNFIVGLARNGKSSKTKKSTYIRTPIVRRQPWTIEHISGRKSNGAFSREISRDRTVERGAFEKIIPAETSRDNAVDKWPQRKGEGVPESVNHDIHYRSRSHCARRGQMAAVSSAVYYGEVLFVLMAA